MNVPSRSQRTKDPNEIAQHPAVIDVPVNRGHIVLFSNNPMWRGETQGSYFLVYNALLNFDSLNAGRMKRDDTVKPPASR